MGEMVRVWAAPTEKAGTKTLIGDRTEAVLVELDSDHLRDGLQKWAMILESWSPAPQKKDGKLGLKQIKVGLEISAEGGISLVGTAKVGAKATIELTFERA